MPPKSKFTKEEIIAAAVRIAEEQGIEGITARALGEKLGSSARPVFTVFKNMEELIGEVIKAVRELYNAYIKKGLGCEIAFKGVGLEYVKFAVEKPRLFQILFMFNDDKKSDINSILPKIDDNYDKILRSITDSYGIDKENALILYRHLWIYTHGIASLIATGTCFFTDGEIDAMMTDIFQGLLIKLKAEKDKKENKNDQA
ncbi:MAG: TetR/AcrR family transcriptional regulator [Firmicutes bacterium]|nr:TetR/AcrR family transcriptional regulator [[Eubacterium] siraeum]MCM1488810.1 TetR/AcrR family transcriptional regulator [Bacillota bacterium]